MGASTAGLPDATAEDVALGLAREGEDERAGGGGGGDAEEEDAPAPSLFLAAAERATEMAERTVLLLLLLLGRLPAARPSRAPCAPACGRARERMASV